MKKLIIVLNVISAIYFFAWANIFFWFSLIGFFLSMSSVQTKTQFSWLMPIDFLLAPFLIYGAIMFFRKTSNKYNYGLAVLIIISVTYLFYPSIANKHFNLTIIDFQNSLFFIIPMAFIYFTKWLDKKILT